MSTFQVQRSATLPATPDAVYARIADFHRWTEWSPWEGMDPDLARTYTGPDSGVGATYAWSGNRKAGAGEMSITAAEPQRRIELNLNFIKPFRSNNTTVFDLEDRDGQTHVTWTMTGPKSLMAKVMGIFVSMDKLIGKDFERGLEALGKAASTDAVA